MNSQQQNFPGGQQQQPVQGIQNIHNIQNIGTLGNIQNMRNLGSLQSISNYQNIQNSSQSGNHSDLIAEEPLGLSHGHLNQSSHQVFFNKIGKGPEETVTKSDLALFLKDPSVEYKYTLELQTKLSLPLVKERNFS